MNEIICLLEDLVYSAETNILKFGSLKFMNLPLTQPLTGFSENISTRGQGLRDGRSFFILKVKGGQVANDEKISIG